MIEIIKRGTKTVTDCKMCGCKFMFENEDIQEECVDGYKQYREYVMCPQCDEKVIITQTRK